MTDPRRQPGGGRLLALPILLASLIAFAGTLTGLGTGGTFTLDAANTYDDAGATATLTFADFDNLAGGGAADFFVFNNGGTVVGNVDGAGGADTIDWSAYGSNRVVTLTGIGWGVVLFGERHSPWVWGAAGLIFTGLALVNLRRTASAGGA